MPGSWDWEQAGDNQAFEHCRWTFQADGLLLSIFSSLFSFYSHERAKQLLSVFWPPPLHIDKPDESFLSHDAGRSGYKMERHGSAFPTLYSSFSRTKNPLECKAVEKSPFFMYLFSDFI